MADHGHFHWNELMARDVEQAKKFYSNCIGWTYNAMLVDGYPDYFVIMDGETPIGGMFEMTGPEFEGVPDHWMAYISVDDVDARVAKAKSNGAKIKREPFDVPGVGRICLMQQPGGAAIGWMTPES